MSYIDQSRRSSPASIAVVVGIHVAIGYAFISGLAYTVIRAIPHNPIITQVPNEPPPPPRHIETPRSKLPTPDTTPVPPRTDVLKPDDPILPLPPLSNLNGDTGGGGTTLPPADPPKANQAHDAVPGNDRLRWITTDDYPTAALREGVIGTVVLSAMIGADGRVRSCLVTQSSGSQLLDDTTCRLYTKRGHFTPARDADGNPTTAQRTDRFRWQIPNE